MSREGQEASRIGQHADKATDQTHVGKGVHLLFHAVLLVEVPPSGAKLYFSFHRTVVEVADHCRKDFIVAGIEVVDDCLRKLVRGIQFI